MDNIIADPQSIQVPKAKTFDTFNDLYGFANQLCGKVTVQASRVWSDRFKRYRPKDRYTKLLGISRRAIQFAERIAPGGKWNLEIETPNTTFYHAGILDPIAVKTVHFRCSAWYNRFLPYAIGMLGSEYGFKAFGVDYDSINSYHGTVMGFVDMGLGNDAWKASDGHPAYSRFVEEDLELFDRIYSTSCDIDPPSLPFDEAYRPCAVFVALHRPEYVVKFCDHAGFTVRHIANVCNRLGLPQPKYKWGKKAA